MHNLEKLYKYAKSIAGDDGEDLLHHCFLLIQGKEIKHFETYLYRVMLNEYTNKKSSYNKQLQTIVEVDESETSEYDINTLHTILLILENEGYQMHVKIFKECYFVSSISSFSKKTNIDRRVIAKICNFVKSEIKKRYAVNCN
jgi:hypothetical protein